MKRGQASIEFITIFGFIFLMTIPLILIFFDQMGSVQDSLAQNQLRNVAIKLTDKAEAIYYLGEPSKTTVKAYFPERIEYIHFISRTVLFGIRNTNGRLDEVYSVSKVNITGNLSIQPGLHYITIEAVQGEVMIKE